MKSIFVAIALLALVAVPAHAKKHYLTGQAYNDSLLAAEPDSMKLREVVYQGSKKSTSTAVLLELLAPTAGCAYAGSWSHGLPWLLLDIGGIALIASADRPTYYAGSSFVSDGGSDQRSFGGAILMAGLIGAMVTAEGVARSTNRKIRARIGLAPLAFDHGTGAGVGVTVHFGGGGEGAIAARTDTQP